MTFFIPLCKDLYPTVFSFLLYTESISLQKCSSFSLKQKEKMDKYCQHIYPHGNTEEYDRKTKLQLYKYNYKEGKLNGIQKDWYENGQLRCEFNYKEGKEEGIQKEWYENGQLWYEDNYKEGKQDGIQKSWYENGQLHYKMYYKNGKLMNKQLYEY